MKKLVLTGVAVVMLLFGGIAYAAIPSTDGTIHGCRKLNNPAKGSVIVIDAEASESCPNGFAALDWNQTGPTGPAGSVGPQGPSGVSGYEIVVNTQDVTVSEPLFTASLSASCPAGKKVLGGGGVANRPGFGLVRSNPSASGWDITVQRFSGEENPTQLNVWAVCATVN